jgi:2'-5' RNA ligase
MREVNIRESSDSSGLEALERFRNIRWLRNHWARPASPRGYYWYLTFENSPSLHSLVAECQEALAFPYYDLLPLPRLHLTLDRIAPSSDITLEQLHAIEAAAIRACQEIPPFEITIGFLAGTPGAIGYTACPAQPILSLRDTLRASVLSVYAGAPARGPDLHPHVTIAYANSDGVPAAEVLATIEKLHTARVVATIEEVALVLLERRQRSYEWQVVSRIPLDGRG